RAGNASQETCKIIGDVIHVRGITSLELPILAEYLTGAFRNHQYRGHPQRVRYCEIACEILEHGRTFGVDAMRCQESFIGLRRSLRLKVGCHDVEDILEMPVDGEPLNNGIGVLACAVGQYELSSDNLFQRGA